ncbi:N-formylglutamate amidohydrolase [Microlunatus speluncae]|uniref:N-formylglutamate amidohydrolase n=1 Tax=Microlunatus speluncae TaxID=2594267 RepID=UPI001C2DCC35|nr:N-formylglutamate amidohydrolase [Microlunatus speluncae]
MTPVTIVPGAASSPVVIHVPHAATEIPEAVRRDLLLDDEELAAELAAMTDEGTEQIGRLAAGLAGTRPWLAINRFSRLVVDPERFPDEREEMARVGMAAVYTRTSARRPLRDERGQDFTELLETYYRPYGDALADLVDARLIAAGRAIVIDLHSYPRLPLRYELHPDRRRPMTCIGTDSFHTPEQLRETLRDAFAPLGSVAYDEPFAGCYIPLRQYRKTLRVTGVMIELRRDGCGTAAAVRRRAETLAAVVDTLTPAMRR